MKTNQLKAGVVLSYCTRGIQILSGLLYTPIMLRLLGQSEYGLYQLVYSVISYLGLLSFGFGSGYLRFYSGFKAVEDKKSIAGLNAMFLLVFAILSMVCLLCGALLITNSENVFGGGLTNEELKKAEILMAIMVFNLALTFISTVFSNIVISHERFFFQRIVEMLKAIFNPFLTLPLLLLGYGSVGMVLVTTFLTILELLLNIFYCRKYLKAQFDFKRMNPGLFKEIWQFTFFVFISMIVDQINWSIDKFLLGRMMNTVAVAVYGVAGQLNTMYMTFSGTVNSVFVPRVNMIVAKNENNCDSQLTVLFTRVGRIQLMILGLIISGYILFGKEFVALWAGEEYLESYYVGLLLMVPATVPLIQNLGIEIQKAKNLHRARSIIYLIVAVFNCMLSIYLIRKLGVFGAALGTALSLIVGNGIFMNWYYHCKVHIDIGYFWKNNLLIMLCIVILSIVFTRINSMFIVNDFVGLAVKIFVYASIYAIVMLCFCMNTNEKDILRNIINK